MTHKKVRMPKVQIEDSIAQEFAELPKEARANKVLITGFVVILETYDGNQRRLKVKKSKDLPEWTANGMLGWSQGAFSPDEDEDDDSDYNPEWYWNQ